MYQIVIPSYNRPTELREKTLATLERYNIDKTRIYLFIELSQLYKYDTFSDYKIVVGRHGIVNQRKCIEDFFPENTNIVSIDDDIEDIDFNGFDSLDDFFIAAFQKCIDNTAYLWGVYPVWNPFFREKKSMTTHLSFICAAFYGFINRPNLIEIECGEQKEDVERSIKIFLNDGIVLRFNHIGYKTKYYANSGGLGNFDSRLNDSIINTKLLNEKYPDITSIKIKKNAMHELVLKKQKAFKKNVPYYYCDFNDDTHILDLLNKTKFHNYKRKDGRASSFGDYTGLTLGYVKGRISRKIDLSFHTKKNMELYEEIVRIGKLICPFEFEAIQLNKNVQTPKHKDLNNSGLSCIISFGEYEGLDLIVEGELYDIRNRALIFDGANNMHWNTPLVSGTKYSIVYFKSINV